MRRRVGRRFTFLASQVLAGKGVGKSYLPGGFCTAETADVKLSAQITKYHGGSPQSGEALDGSNHAEIIEGNGV